MTDENAPAEDRIDVARIVEHIDMICDHRGITPAAACREIGISHPMLTMMRRGEVPGATVIERVRKWLKPDQPAYLVGEEPPPVTVNQAISAARSKAAAAA